MRRSLRSAMTLAVVLAAGSAAAGACAPTPGAGATAVAAAGQARTRPGTFEIVAEYPHDPAAYTQGLFWHDGYLYEGTGRVGTSWLRKVDPRTGEVLQQISLPDPYFGEGIALHDDRIFQLTWLAKRGFIWDAATFEPLGEFPYNTEGWGLTTDGTHLILSDGSPTLQFLDPHDHFVARTVRVRDNGTPLDDLNELEYVDGLLYANVWHSDTIYAIDPSSGDVVQRIDFSTLLAGNRPRDAEGVLNGIAHDPTTGHLFVTGKLWPRIFEVRLVDSGGR